MAFSYGFRGFQYFFENSAPTPERAFKILCHDIVILLVEKRLLLFPSFFPPLLFFMAERVSPTVRMISKTTSLIGTFIKEQRVFAEMSRYLRRFIDSDKSVGVDIPHNIFQFCHLQHIDHTKEHISPVSAV